MRRATCSAPTRGRSVATSSSCGPSSRSSRDSGDALTNFLADATFPFPLEGLIKSAKGDYLNLFLTVDLTTKAITATSWAASPRWTRCRRADR